MKAKKSQPQRIANFATHIQTFLLVHLLCSVQAQVTEVVNSKTLSAFAGKSYVYKTDVRLLPGFSVSAQTNGEFFCRNLYHRPPSEDQNFVRTETVLVQGITQETQLAALPVEEKATSYQYVDGLGRNLQSTIVEGSPLKSDLIVAAEYDQNGRQPKEYLPFAHVNDVKGEFRNSAITDQGTFYSGPPPGVAGGFKAFKESVFEPSPLDRVVEVISPRDDPWNSAPGKVTAYLKVNSADEVILWKDFVSGLPEKTGTHPANHLMVQETTDEEGKITKLFTNLRGQIILTRVGDGTTWFDTYNIYSPSGMLMFVIQPEGVARLATEYDNASSTDKQSFIDRWAFQYQYDDEQRMIAKRIPGHAEGPAGWTYIVYDRWNRMVLTQDPVQRVTNEYGFTKYDRFNRPIMTGLYTTSTPLVTLRSNAAGSSIRFETEVSNQTGYTLSGTFPTGIAESSLLTVTYYDNYDFLSYSGWDAEGNSFVFTNVNGYPQTTDVFPAVKGQTTGSKVRVLGQTRWLNSVNHYDNKYRPIQVFSEHHLGGIIRTTSKLDFAGRMEKSQQYVSYSTLTVEHRFTYDHAGRQLTVHHRVNGQPEVLMTSNKYNELGQVVEKNVHSADNGTTFLQSVDFRYNIKGWMTSINNSTLTAAPNNDDTNDLFGMELDYYTNTPASVGPAGSAFVQKSFYDGNISAIRWKTDTKQGAPVQRIYAFEYDVLSRLKQAWHAVKVGSSWTGEPNFFNEQITGYDRNGNIGGIIRNGKVQGVQTAIDNLSYNYTLNNKVSNRLVAMEDATGHALGFKPASASISEEYQYDNNGNLKFDHNKQISSILYNHLNLPKEIQFTRPGGQVDKMEYTYDATGIKLTKVVRVNGTQVWKTDYVGGIQYDNNTLSFFATSEGRMTNNNGTFEYEYFHKDHQRNTRLAYGPLKETLTYRATMETPLSSAEESAFSNIAATRHTDPAFNYSKSSEQVLVPDKSARLNGFTGTAIGPARSLRVLTGDKVYMETFARYNQVTGSNSIITAATLISAVAGSFGIINSGETATLWQSFNNNLPGVSAGMGGGTTVPKAYLVWLFFNDNFGYVRSGAQAITTSAYHAFEKLSRSFTADQDGYIYLYIANESNVSTAVNVHFDELYVVHEKNSITLQVTQASDYYPFGLSFNEYQADRLEETSAGVYEPQLRNRYLFQGQEQQRDLDLGWYQFKWRMHDPAIGRFGGVDPLAEKYVYNSVYAFSENKLIKHVELEGLESWDVGISAFFGTTKAITETEKDDPSFSDYVKTGFRMLWNGSQLGSAFNNIVTGTTREVSSKVDLALNGGEQIQQAIQSGQSPQQVIDHHEQEQAEGRIQTYSGVVQTTLFATSLQASLFTAGLSSSTSAFSLSSSNYGIPFNPSFSVGVNTSRRAFFSGPGTEAQALNRGFTTLGQSRAGQNLAKLTADMPYYPGSQAYNMWGRLSAQWAKGASGEIHVFQNASMGVDMQSIWRVFEYPALKVNQNIQNIVYHY